MRGLRRHRGRAGGRQRQSLILAAWSRVKANRNLQHLAGGAAYDSPKEGPAGIFADPKEERDGKAHQLELQSTRKDVTLRARVQYVAARSGEVQ